MIFILFGYMQYIKTFLGTQLENIKRFGCFFQSAPAFPSQAEALRRELKKHETVLDQAWIHDLMSLPKVL